MLNVFAFNPVNLANLVNPVYCSSSSFLRALRVLRGEILISPQRIAIDKSLYHLVLRLPKLLGSSSLNDLTTVQKINIVRQVKRAHHIMRY